jgi:hypothetical protein
LSPNRRIASVSAIEQIDLDDENGPSNSPRGDDHPYLGRQLSVF